MAWEFSLLVVANVTAESDELIDCLRDRAEQGACRFTLVMPATGAYCYSLQNNYNGARKPPVVLVNDGMARLAVRRETLSDLTRRDC